MSLFPGTLHFRMDTNTDFIEIPDMYKKRRFSYTFLAKGIKGCDIYTDIR